ncbi:MAG: hypothetical protein OEZ06_16485 [Myxococcales bacterium]|nr:hypothetical protein [Myxococcales bacterium]
MRHRLFASGASGAALGLALIFSACGEAGAPEARPPGSTTFGPTAGASGNDPGATTQAGTGTGTGTGQQAGTVTQPGGDTTVPVTTTTGTPIPCNVAKVVTNACHGCHGPTPIGGAMKLVSHEDWHRDSPLYGPNTLMDATKKVYEVAQIRIDNGEMPQGGTLSAEDKLVLDGWLSGGAIAGTDADAVCDTGPAPTGPGPLQDECGGADAYEPLVALPGETCYDFRVHGISSPTDTSKFNVAPGESYHEFIYDVPWPAGSAGTRFGADFDNLQVLHHWLAFGYTTTQPGGTVNVNVTGTTLFANAKLIGGWAVGGCNFITPDDMAIELPPSGKLMIQWHMYNTTGVSQPDGTAVQFCTVPPGGRPNLGGLTWLGTENLTMGPGMHDKFGTCINDSGAPITIVAFLPHLHTYGINMRSEVQRVGSTTWETVFDQPFDFNWQVHYMMDPPIVLQPNDAIKSTCTFFNDSGGTVAFGQSTNQEMCYQFAFSYPAGALDNGVLSLIGATNTCWQFGE